MVALMIDEKAVQKITHMVTWPNKNIEKKTYCYLKTNLKKRVEAGRIKTWKEEIIFKFN